MAASVPVSRLLIFGGNGFVGQAIARKALLSGLEVISLSKNGFPKDLMHDLDKIPAYDTKMAWEKADITKGREQEWVEKNLSHDKAFKTSVVSCVGMFSRSNEEMKAVNGYANVETVAICHEKGARRFIFISAYPVEDELPVKLLPGYFEGKRIAEQAVMNFFPGPHGTILQPGMVYGTRIQSGQQIPLGAIGAPLEFLWNLPGLSQLRNLPMIGKFAFSPPVSVHDVATTVVKAAKGELVEQYDFDEIAGARNDDNDHHPQYKANHEAIVLDIDAIKANAANAATAATAAFQPSRQM